MPRTCTVCVHAKRNEIETELESRSPFRNVAEQFSLTASSLFRHQKNCLTKAESTSLTLVNNTSNADPADQEIPERETLEVTIRQRRFVDFLLGEAKFNATRACELAGYTGIPETLAASGSRLLKSVKVRALINSRLETEHMSSAEILAELSRIARSDPENFLEVKTGKNDEVISATLPLKDKLRALELLAKNAGLLTEAVVQERIVVVMIEKARRVYSRIRDEFPSLEDRELRDWLGPILEVEPEQLGEAKRLAS